MGGTDEPENLIKLTIEEHAEAHRLLWEKYNCWQDYLAWQGLAKMITHEELLAEIAKITGRIGVRSRSLNTGKKYKWKKGQPKPVGTSGLKWYHNPLNLTEKCCIKEDDAPPDNWIRGQGKKSKNPGLNFQAKRRKVLDKINTI